MSWRTWPGLSAFACFEVGAAGELSLWPFPAQCEGEKDHLPVTSPSPEGCGSVSRAYVSGTLQALRGAQLTRLTGPRGPASSRGGSSLGMEFWGGCLGWSCLDLHWGIGSHCTCPSQQRSTQRAGKLVSFGGLEEGVWTVESSKNTKTPASTALRGFWESMFSLGCKKLQIFGGRLDLSWTWSRKGIT